jgi:hypothetical protein
MGALSSNRFRKKQAFWNSFDKLFGVHVCKKTFEKMMRRELDQNEFLVRLFHCGFCEKCHKVLVEFMDEQRENVVVKTEKFEHLPPKIARAVAKLKKSKCKNSYISWLAWQDWKSSEAV